MRDGTPNGYATISFEANQYRLKYKVAGAHESKQMSLSVPHIVGADMLESTSLYSNFYMGTEYSKAYYRFDHQGEWREMQRSDKPDPRTVAMHEYQKTLFASLSKDRDQTYRMIDTPEPSDHLWKGALSKALRRRDPCLAPGFRKCAAHRFSAKDGEMRAAP